MNLDELLSLMGNKEKFDELKDRLSDQSQIKDFFTPLSSVSSSDPVSLKRLSPIMNALDQTAARILDPDSRKTIVMGHPSAGKSFLIEQIAYNVSHYLKYSNLSSMEFLFTSDTDMMKIGNSKNLRDRLNGYKKGNNIEHDDEVCFVTDSVETALFIASALPKVRIILEVNTDGFFNLMTRATAKTWASWQVIDANALRCSYEQLINLLWETAVKRLNTKFHIQLKKRNVRTFIDLVLKTYPDLVDQIENDDIVLVPPGVWGTAFRHLMGSLTYTSDPAYLTKDGEPNFRKILAKSFDQIEYLFRFYRKETSEVQIAHTPEDIIDLLQKSSGIKIMRVGEEDEDDVTEVTPFIFGDTATLSDRLKEEVLGQDKTIEKISSGLVVPTAGLQDNNKPLRSFLFLGPTGVGKTQLALILGKELGEEPMNLVRIDMSEYQQEHEVSKLFGAPPGYVGHESGGQLTSAVNDNPHSIILLDEIEKAHPKVWDSFLQVFDSGRMTDNQGRIVDFTQSIIIMTSNIGDKSARGTSPGFSRQNLEKHFDQRQKQVSSILMNEVEKSFRPEFINRIDEIVIFNELPVSVLESIIRREIEIVGNRIEERGFLLDGPNAEVISSVLKRSDISKYGAREIQRVVLKNVTTPLAHYMISNNDSRHLQLQTKDNEIVVVDPTERGN